jgi:hypothetical protein
LSFWCQFFDRHRRDNEAVMFTRLGPREAREMGATLIQLAAR